MRKLKRLRMRKKREEAVDAIKQVEKDVDAETIENHHYCKGKMNELEIQ